MNNENVSCLRCSKIKMFQYYPTRKLKYPQSNLDKNFKAQWTKKNLYFVFSNFLKIFGNFYYFFIFKTNQNSKSKQSSNLKVKC